MKTNFSNTDKFICLNEWLKNVGRTAIDIALDYWGIGKTNPSEVTISEKFFSYYSHRIIGYDAINDGYERFLRWDYGNDVVVIFIQIFENVLGSMDDITDPKESALVGNILHLDTWSPLTLKHLNLCLNKAVPGADLFMWASSRDTLHITDLSQNLDFKNVLKKKGLI